MRFLFLLIFVQFYSIQVTGQGGWTKSKGELFSKLDFSRLSSDNYYTPIGTKLKTNEFTQQSVNLYAEYGLKESWNLIFSGPLYRQNSFSTTNAVRGIGDLRIDMKYRLVKNNNWPVSISVGVEVPTGKANAFAQSKLVPQEKINLPTGDGEWNVWTTLAASKSLGKAYISLFGAYNFRTKYSGLPFADLYQLGGEIGVNPVKNLWLNTKLRSQWATAESKHPELGFVRGDGTTYTLWSAEAFYRITNKIGVSATYLSGNDWLAPFKNIYISSYYSLGITYELKPKPKSAQ